MKLKMVILMVVVLLVIGCQDHAKRHEAFNSVLEDCKPGATISISKSFGNWGDSVEASCTWVKE